MTMWYEYSRLTRDRLFHCGELTIKKPNIRCMWCAKFPPTKTFRISRPLTKRPRSNTAENPQVCSNFSFNGSYSKKRRQGNSLFARSCLKDLEILTGVGHLAIFKGRCGLLAPQNVYWYINLRTGLLYLSVLEGTCNGSKRTRMSTSRPLGHENFLSLLLFLYFS